MTITAATGLVAGSAFTSYTIVYADENNDKAPHTSTSTSSSSSSRAYSSDKYDSPSRREYMRTHFSDRRPMISQEEDLMPGLVYVALAGVTGSLVARQSMENTSIILMKCSVFALVKMLIGASLFLFCST